MIQITVFTLHPELYPGPLGISCIGRGLQEKKWHLKTVHLRDYAQDAYGTVDDTPYGGSVGMVIKPDLVDRALRDHYMLQENIPPQYEGKLIYLSPRGRLLSQNYAKRLAEETQIGLICGRFEGLDQRVIDHWAVEEISIGDFILAGGDLAAMTLAEAVIRIRPTILGSKQSLEEESFQNGLLEYPLYTKPRQWRGMCVPSVLVSGNHPKIARWKKEQAEKETYKRRPDLWKEYLNNKEKERE